MSWGRAPLLIEIVQGATQESLVSNRDHARVVATRIQAVVHAARDRAFRS